MYFLITTTRNYLYWQLTISILILIVTTYNFYIKLTSSSLQVLHTPHPSPHLLTLSSCQLTIGIGFLIILLIEQSVVHFQVILLIFVYLFVFVFVFLLIVIVILSVFVTKLAISGLLLQPHLKKTMTIVFRRNGKKRTGNHYQAPTKPGRRNHQIPISDVA